METSSQYSCPENPMHTGAWASAVHGSQKSDMTELTQHACIQPHMFSGHHTGYLRVYFIFHLPTSIIFSWKAFYFEYSTVHTSIPNSPLSVPPLFPSVILSLFSSLQLCFCLQISLPLYNVTEEGFSLLVLFYFKLNNLKNQLASFLCFIRILEKVGRIMISYLV